MARNPKRFSRFVLLLVFAPLAFSLLGCAPPSPGQIQTSAQTQGLRPLKSSELATDFDFLVADVLAHYGPLQYKEKKFGFKFQKLAETYRARAIQAKSNEEFTGILTELLAELKDGHVSLKPSIRTKSFYNVPIDLTTIEDRVLIHAINIEDYETGLGIEVGDEVLLVDGKPPLSYLPQVKKYATIGNPASDQYLVYYLLHRKSHFLDLIPTRPSVQLKIQKPTGQTKEVEIPWLVINDPGYPDREIPRGGDPLEYSYASRLADFPKSKSESKSQSGYAEIGEEKPFFINKKVQEEFKMARVKPSEAYLEKYGLDTKKTDVPDIYAYLYRHEGKSLLLIRLATYDIENFAARIAWYKAVLDEWGQLADALVIDQTNNPGGSSRYGNQFVSLFASGTGRGLRHFLRADRKWLEYFSSHFTDKDETKFDQSRHLMNYKIVEKAYDEGRFMTPVPISVAQDERIEPDAKFTFKKPILMLINGLSGSCGDRVPALMKSNGYAKLFGERTMGLGGSVEEMGPLPHSRISYNLTRGLAVVQREDGSYDLEILIENNGVEPDIKHHVTVDDFRKQYLGYVKSFSDAAVQLIK